MDRKELARAFRNLDDLLETRQEVILLGGAAMILGYGLERATQDVDGFFPSAGATELRDKIRQVASEMGLPDDWFNDTAKGYMALLPRDFTERLFPIDLGLKKLKLLALGRPEMVVLKIIALRQRDEEDLEWLKIKKGDVSVIIEHLERLARLRKDLALKVKLYLEEAGWRIK